MKTLINILLFNITVSSFGQTKLSEDFGFRHFQLVYRGDTTDILVKSQKGEENFAKPLFFYCQGSLPQPLIKTDGDKTYGVFSFKPDSLIKYFHIAIVGKPYVPLIMDKKDLDNRFCYLDTNGHVTKKYSDRNLLDYYTKRNIEVIKFLQKQKWISSDKLVLAGHSEGSTIVAKMASVFPKVTHLIYSSGNPFGRIMSIIGESRSEENDTTKIAEGDFEMWKNSVDSPNDLNFSQGDTHKATVEFSNPPIQYLEKLKIPVLICYGTKDWCAPFNDYLRIETIRKRKANFTFNAYIGTEHNFFPLKGNGEVNYDIFNWDKVANDWLKWLNTR
jgi:hypothetical protein